MAYYLIENCDRPGYYWSSANREFASEFGRDFKAYTTKARAVRAAAKLSRVYAVRIVERDSALAAWETAMGMRGYSGSAAEKENRK